MKKILLIAPASESAIPLYNAHNLPFLQKKGLMVPLHIATIAALTPDDIEVDLWDEAVDAFICEETKFEKEYDLVGVTGMSNQIARAKEIARVFRSRGIPVVIGGPGVSAAPEKCRNDFDVLFIGEGEGIWLEFIDDFRKGSYRKEYREVSPPDMSHSPIPRWGRLAGSLRSGYLMGAIQTTRGCPFTCEFCTVWQVSGRQMRLKPVERVVEEIKLLEKLEVADIFICSDNFIGNPRYAKELLQAIIEVNRTFAKPMKFLAEITLNISHMEDMLCLLSEANFKTILIGLESPSVDSLKEIRKVQNLRGDMARNCKKVMSHGIIISGSMIVGFDNDTTDIFDQHFNFLQEACIPHPQVHILKAIDGTDLLKRFSKEGRILDYSTELFWGTVHPQLKTNIIPKQMTRAELLSGYLRLKERLFDWENFAARTIGFILNLKDKVEVSEFVGKELTGFLDEKEERTISGILESLSKSSKAREAIYRILSVTKDCAPWMVREIVRLVVKQHLEASGLVLLRESVNKQIEYEAAMDIRKFVEKPHQLNIIESQTKVGLYSSLCDLP
ncbi:MAG: B12-binding domain-containing radical SAM protein [Blastocatellia bacterium]|nr:B12-binding domain-containing radical SAM protein [Blastocatellia bacterium]